jgi:protoheme ferro-lyase
MKFTNNKCLEKMIKHDLRRILGALHSVPKDISPNEDKGIYLEKAKETVRELLEKYEVYP